MVEKLPPTFAAAAAVYCNLVSQQAIDTWQAFISVSSLKDICCSYAYACTPSFVLPASYATQDNSAWSGGLPSDSVQAITALLGQDTLINAARQQLVSHAVKLAAYVGITAVCLKSKVRFGFPKGSAPNLPIHQHEVLDRSNCRQCASSTEQSGLHAQVYLHNNGSTNDVAFELSCPALEDPAGLLPVFIAQMPAQSLQPGQIHATALNALCCPLTCVTDLQRGL